MNYERMEIHLVVNKMEVLFDFFSSFFERHEKSLQGLLADYDCKSAYSKNLMLSECHVIDCIGKNQLTNATFIAKELGITKGAVSKISTKLLEKNLVKANRLENNKKEIYYTLTNQGKEIFEIHKKLHNIENEKLVGILNKYNKEELNVINNFLDDLLHEF